MFALRVKKEFTEEVRKSLFKMGLVDKKCVFLKNGDYVEVPLIRKLEKDEIAQSTGCDAHKQKTAFKNTI